MHYLTHHLFRQPFKPSALALVLLTAMACANVNDDDVAQDDTSTPTVMLGHETILISRQPKSTTTGIALSQKDTPQSVATVSKQELQERNISDLTEAVKTTTGVNVVKDQSRVRFQSRGFYMDQLSEDGMSQNLGGRSGYSDKIDVSTMTDLAIYDRIEVVRGATGLTQANSEPGGTINLVRKRPTHDFHHAGELSVNSWGSVRGMLDVSGGLNTSDSVRGRAIVVHEDNQSFKDRVEGKKTLGSGSVEFDIGDNATAMIGATYQHTKDMPDFGGVILPCVQTNRWASKCENDGLQDFDHKTYLGMN